MLILALALALPAAAFAVPPNPTSVAPNAAIAGSRVNVRVYGTDLYTPCGPYCTVKLHRAGTPDISAPGTAGCGGTNYLGATLSLGSAPLGRYDVIVIRDDGQSATLPGAFEVRADPNVKIELIGAWGGSVDAVCIQQNGPQTLAYVGSGVRMFVVDVTDPANVVEVGHVLIGGPVRDIKLRDGLAYVSAGATAWLTILDVSNPAVPVILWSGLRSGNGQTYTRSALHGNRLYELLTGGNNADCYDISNPQHPIQCIHCLYGGTEDVLVVGDIMYMAGDAGYVAALDISNHFGCTSPPVLGLIYIPELNAANSDSISIALNGNYLYVTARSPNVAEPLGRIFVVDFTSPHAPVHVGTWGDGPDEAINMPRAAAVSDGRLYVVDWMTLHDPDNQGLPHPELLIFDIATNPAVPALVGQYWMVGAATEVTVVGTTVYLCDEREGLLILDCSDPANVTRVGGWHSPAFFAQGLLDGHTLYATDCGYGVNALDVTDPRAPQLLGKHATGGIDNWGLAKRDDKLYVGAGLAGLQVVNATNPAAPVLAGAFPFGGAEAGGLGLYDDDVYGLTAAVGVWPGAWLVNFAVTDPQNITELGYVAIGGGAAVPRSIVIASDRIGYISRENGRITTDASDAANPFFISGDIASGDIQKEGNILYSASGWQSPLYGLHIYDVSNPDAQTEVAFFPEPVDTAPQGVYSVAVRNGVACMGTRGGGLHVIDVANPASPALLAQLVPGNAPVSTVEDLILDGPVLYAVTSHDQDIGAGVLVYLVWSPGDFDADRDVDLADFAELQACFTGAGTPLPADAPVMCRVFDFNADGDVDLADLAGFADSMIGCDPPPAGPLGACCVPEGTCTDGVTAPDCTYTLGGQYQGNGTTCDNVICPPTGACCLPYGSDPCAEWTEYACLDCGGTYQGDGSDCMSSPCPYGACCNPADGTCSEKRPSTCAASGGVYQGDGATCATTTCPWGKYANTIDPMTSATLAGTGLMLADDLTLAGTGARDLTYLDLRVYGNGGGAFDVTVELWTACPGSGGTLIPGTTFTWTAVPDDGYVHELVVDPLSPPVTIPDTVWMTATFSTPQAGWIIAEQAEIGTTANVYGRNSPPWACNRTLTGTHAGLWANLQCVVGESKAASDGQSQLRIERIEASGSPLAVEPQ